MPFTISCTKCQKTLAAPDAAIGKKVRCPNCQEIFPVAAPPQEIPAAPEALTATPPAPAKKNPAAWDDDKGPIEVEEELPPKKKQTSDAETFKLEDQDEDGDEDRRRRRRKKRRRDFDDDDDDEYDVRRPTCKPHRASTITLLGTLSIVLCCAPLVAWILGGYAINMAKQDLLQMSAKKMDPSGRGSTETGKILGITGCVLGTIMFLVILIVRISSMRIR
jgi:phage FluMu protein Com